MRKILLILSLFLIQNCSKPKTVLICGDHICVNKNEAEQYFEENLSIEVKILDKKKSKNDDLVQLNLEKDSNKIIIQINGKKREILISTKSLLENELVVKIKKMPKLKKFFENKNIKKIVYIKNRLINFII